VVFDINKAAEMSKLLMSICCCNGTDEEDEQYLVLNHDQDEADGPFRQQTQQINPTDFPSATNGHAVGGNRLTPPSSVNDQTKTREQQEADLLNKILHHAQESIIDVSHIDENSSDNIDVSQRSRAYSEALRKHDAKRKSNRNEDDSNSLGFLITDSSAESSSSNRPQHIQSDEISLILKTSEIFGEAVKSSLGIQPTETLVAYMSMDWLDILLFFAQIFMQFSGCAH